VKKRRATRSRTCHRTQSPHEDPLRDTATLSRREKQTAISVARLLGTLHVFVYHLFACSIVVRDLDCVRDWKESRDLALKRGK